MLPTLRPFDLDFTSYVATQQVKTNCNSIQFINVGTNTVKINGTVELITNQTFTIEGNENEICTATLLLSFINTGGSNNCTVIKKNFV